ncbi:MAG: glycosyltransferase family 39 protein, partial [Acidimicrobiales bacterium]|nr:glycosyltransferase family 39 protein [Acidimicrobiales bacterium]
MATTAPPEPRAPAPERAGAPRAPLAPLAVLGAVAVLSALALAGLGRRSLWLDEAISVGATEQLVRTWRDTGGTMAAYYALLTPWSWVSVDRWWLRLLSLLLAAAALVVVHAVARRLVSARGAAAATLATAASWLVVRYAQEARAYALVLLVCSASWWALVRAVDAPTDDARAHWWRRYAVLVVLAPLAHGLAVLQFAAQVA